MYTGCLSQDPRAQYLGYLPTDFYEIQNADTLGREGSISNNKITSS
jgi:hypothetical protein